MSRKLKCVVCGKSYDYCPHCDSHKPRWMESYCSENCKLIFDACSGFAGGSIDKATAKEMLSGANLSKKAEFTKQIQRNIADIFAPDKKPVQEEKKGVKVNNRKNNYKKGPAQRK